MNEVTGGISSSHDLQRFCTDRGNHFSWKHTTDGESKKNNQGTENSRLDFLKSINLHYFINYSPQK